MKNENIPSQAVSVRPLTADEWPLLKETRLRALKTDPAMFTAYYETEVLYDDNHWQCRPSAHDRQVFGVFHEEKIIGMTAVRIDSEDPSGATARFWGSWLDKEWRGRGISADLYAARFDWVRQRPYIKKIVMSHRESNQPSRKAIERHGFRFTHAVDHVWKDGATEKDCFYELLL